MHLSQVGFMGTSQAYLGEPVLSSPEPWCGSAVLI